jgi:hypothetical protein
VVRLLVSGGELGDARIKTNHHVVPATGLSDMPAKHAPAEADIRDFLCCSQGSRGYRHAPA